MSSEFAVLARLGELDDRTNEMTVEEFLREHCERTVGKVMRHASELTESVREAFEEERIALMDAMSKRAAEEQEAERMGDAYALDIVLECVAGPYAGKTFVVSPRQKRVGPKVGRSTGKAFKSTGVSLPEDPEVSTSHGKVGVACAATPQFEAKHGAVFYCDTESTNGSFLNG